MHTSKFARTNRQTVAQRVALLRELLPGVQSIAELCCGDCAAQWQAYTQELGVSRFCGLDINLAIVAQNRRLGIDCLCGDVLDPAILRQFLTYDVLFYGPPLSVDYDGHRLLSFAQVTPAYQAFGSLLFGALRYAGTAVFICPKDTTPGDIRWLHHQLATVCADLGLALIHYSYATLTGGGEETELRLKYVELWFSTRLENAWAIRESRRPGDGDADS